MGSSQYNTLDAEFNQIERDSNTWKGPDYSGSFSAPMAVGTFLEQYDLTGKTIIPFCTSGGNNVEISMDFINEAGKGATVLEGITANYASDDALDQWLERTGATE